MIMPRTTAGAIKNPGPFVAMRVIPARARLTRGMEAKISRTSSTQPELSLRDLQVKELQQNTNPLWFPEMPIMDI
jgi:hypothetical protein